MRAGGPLCRVRSSPLTPPGTDFTLSSADGNQNNPDTDPQQTKNVELGAKWDFFHGRLSTNFAVFKTVNDKTVFTDPILGPIPAGKQTVQGVEFSVTRRFTDNWLILASAAYLDSEINSGTTTGGNLAGSALPLISEIFRQLCGPAIAFPSASWIGGGTQYSSDVERRDNSNPADSAQHAQLLAVQRLGHLPGHPADQPAVEREQHPRSEFCAELQQQWRPLQPRKRHGSYTLSADFRY